MRSSSAACACLLVAVIALSMQQLACGSVQQKELAGAYIEGKDWCPELVKQQQQAAPAAPQRSSSGLGRLFSGNSRNSNKAQAEAAKAPPAACRVPFKYCGALASVVERCRTTFGCKAVSYDGKCGLLKTADGPRRARPGWSTYVVA